MKKLLLFFFISFNIYQLTNLQAQNWYEDNYVLDRSNWLSSMTMVAGIQIDGTYSRNSANVLGAFVDTGAGNLECRGVVKMDYYISLTDKYIGYLMISSSTASGESIIFKVFNQSTGKIVSVPATLPFVGDNHYGEATNPYIIVCNFSPTDISITNSSIPENTSGIKTVGNLSTTDADITDNHVYSFTLGEGSTDNALFELNGNVVQTSQVFDFENKNSYSVRISSNDGQGNEFAKILTFNILDINESPSSISLINNTINENMPLATVVGALSALDPDNESVFTFSLVSGNGDTDNSLFSIENQSVKTNQIFNFETKNEYSIRIMATDKGGESIANSFTINVLDANDFPTDILLSANSLKEKQATGTFIGTFSTIDEDTNENSFTYSITTENQYVKLDGNSLLSNQSVDYAAISSFNISVQTADKQGLTYTKSFVIQILKDENVSIISGTLNEQNTIRCYPQPFANSFFCEIQSTENADLAIEIVDIQGKILTPTLSKMQIEAGLNTLEVSGIENLKTGYYLMQIRMGSKTVNRLIMKTE